MIGTGTQLFYGANAWAENLLDVEVTGLKRKAFDSSSMGTTPLTSNATQFGSMTYVAAALSDPGRLKFKVQFTPDAVPKIDEAQTTWALIYPDGTLWTGTGEVEEVETSDPDEAIMTGEYTIKISGNVNVYAMAATPLLNDVSVIVDNDSGVPVYATA